MIMQGLRYLQCYKFVSFHYHATNLSHFTDIILLQIVYHFVDGSQPPWSQITEGSVEVIETMISHLDQEVCTEHHDCYYFPLHFTT